MNQSEGPYLGLQSVLLACVLTLACIGVAFCMGWSA